MIRTFFGKPGVGKTTLAVKLALKQRKYLIPHCNFRNLAPGVRSCDLKELGKTWTFPRGSYVAMDEAGIEFNSRKTLNFPQYMIAWFKLHRHYGVSIDVFSQSWNDMDITIRRLTDQLWYMYRIGPWTLCRRVYKFVTVDQNTQQIIDGYKMANLLWLLAWPLQLLRITDQRFMLTFRPFYYRYFDSWECDDLKERQFPVLNPGKVKASAAPGRDPGEAEADVKENET